MPAMKHAIWLATFTIASLAITGRAFADDPKPFPPHASERIVVLEGESQVFYSKDNTIKAAVVSDPKVCVIAPFSTSTTSAEFKIFALQGLKRGVSQVTFSMESQLSGGTAPVATFSVVVVPDLDARKVELDQLAAFIRDQLNLPKPPPAGMPPDPTVLQIVGVPGSRKVVVSGVAPDQWTAYKIFEMIMSDKITADLIVNKLMVVCPPPPPSPPPCQGHGFFHRHH